MKIVQKFMNFSAITGLTVTPINIIVKQFTASVFTIINSSVIVRSQQANICGILQLRRARRRVARYFTVIHYQSCLLQASNNLYAQTNTNFTISFIINFLNFFIVLDQAVMPIQIVIKKVIAIYLYIINFLIIELEVQSISENLQGMTAREGWVVQENMKSRSITN